MLLLILIPAPCLLAQDLKLTRVTPHGKDVPPPSQLIFEFDREMVPLGRMERGRGEIPIKITPALECEWRWIDTRSLACYLSDQNKPRSATNYSIEIDEGFVALDGAKLPGSISTGFSTSRAKVQYYWLREWSSPGTPAISLTFTEPVDRESAEQKLFFEAKGRRYPAALSQPEGYQGNTSFLAAPKEALPFDSDVKLRVLPGIKSLLGAEPSTDERVILEFKTFPKFSFLGLSCRSNNKEMIRAELGGKCDSLGPVNLLFTSPVEVKSLARALKLGETEFSFEETYPRRYGPVEKEYAVALPHGLKPATEFVLKLLGQELKDEFGRALDRDYQLKFSTDDRLPRLIVANVFSTLESEEDTHLPISVQNLTKLNFNFDTLTKDGVTLGRSLELSPAFVKNVSYFYPLKIREQLRSGLIAGALSGPELTNSHQVLAQVTPFAMHLKQGHRNSTLWVTRLSDGSPVRGAEVSLHRLYPDGTLRALSQPLGATVKTDRLGIAELDGSVVFDPKNNSAFSLTECRAGCEERVEALVYLVKGRGEEIGIIPATSEFELYPYSSEYIHQSTGQLYEYVKSWGMSAQGVYRPGDAIDYKIFVREEYNSSLGAAPEGKYEVKVYDPMGSVVHERAGVKLTEFGSFSGNFSLAKSAVVGKYRFELKPSYSQQTLFPLEVLVSEFTPSQFKVVSEVEGGEQTLKVGSELGIQINASLYAGGPYTFAPVRVTGRMQPVYAPKLPEIYRDFVFDLYEYSEMEENFTAQAKLNDQGESKLKVKVGYSNILYGKLRIESSVSDDRGRYVSSEKVLPFAAKNRYVGLRAADWLMKQGKPFLVEGGVVNSDLKTLAGESFKIEIFRVERVAHRVKGPGNAYLTNYAEEERIVRTCELSSGESPTGCSFIPTEAGQYRIKASVSQEHTSTITRYCLGEGAVVWESGEGRSLEIIPEKKSYKVGEVAKFIVKNPLPGSPALITTERLGVITRDVVKLKDPVSVVEVKITQEHIPGFYLSVVIHAPRSDKPLEEDVDFGKPLTKIGYAKIKVDDGAKQLKVSVKSDRESYRPGEEVELELRGRGELAVVVVDEAVFDLLKKGIRAYDPLNGFYRLGGLDLRNFNSLMTLVGRRKFEKKGASSGGDGGDTGEEDLREIEKFVAYWNPELVVRGSKKIRFQLPKGNLTSWKVIVVAADKDSRFGLAETKFKSTKPLEIAAATPNFLREGDLVKAKFTLLNRAETPREVQVDLSGKKEKLTLVPFKREGISLELQAKGEKMTLPIQASGGGDFYDGLRVTIPVVKNSLTVRSASYRRLEESASRVPLEIPRDVSVPKLKVKLSPTLAANLDPLFSAMRDYPYGCFEQRLSKVMLAANYPLFKERLGVNWDESSEIIQEFLEDLARFQSGGGGFSYFGSAERVDPYLSAYAALVFSWLGELGHSIPPGIEGALHKYLERYLKEDLQPGFYTKGMSSSVRAVALNVLTGRGVVGISEVERYLGKAPEMTLFGKANLLSAAVRSGVKKELISELVRQIRSHGEESSGKLSFQERVFTERILGSSLRDNCMILSALVDYGEEFTSATKLTAHIVEALRDPNTQESVFCSKALVDYQRVVEGEFEESEVTLQLNNNQLAKQLFKSVTDSALELEQSLAVGAQELLSLKTGRGAIYQTAQVSYEESPKRESGVNAGIEIVREYSVEREGKFVPATQLRAGDLVRVDLFVRVPAPRSFVVVDDPLPAAFEAVNRELATSSDADADKAKNDLPGASSFYFNFDDWHSYGVDLWSFYHRELRQDSVRYYSEYLPAGNYHLNYVAQVIAEGTFFAPPARAFEMYRSETYGMTKSEEIVVR